MDAHLAISLIQRGMSGRKGGNTEPLQACECSRDGGFSDLHAAVEGSVDFCGNAHHLSHPKQCGQKIEMMRRKMMAIEEGLTLPVT